MMQRHNRYFGMRHGQSLANVQKIIVSYPTNGLLSDYGLSDVGRDQVKAAARTSGLSADTIIYSSDFSRAYETAEIVREDIGAQKVIQTELLRERYFGDWEKTSHLNYEKIWHVDQTTAESHEHNVEPLAHVWARTRELIKTIENTYQNKDILLVSHGDTLQILQAGLSGVDLTKHRDLLHLETAEIRHLA